MHTLQFSKEKRLKKIVLNVHAEKFSWKNLALIYNLSNVIKKDNEYYQSVKL